MRLRLLAAALLAPIAVSAAAIAQAPAASITAAAPAAELPPHVRREFRGAWVASVANIDWPSRPGLSTAEQQREGRREAEGAHGGAGSGGVRVGTRGL